jgi:DHA2 family multidrug resistance protein-like MFS transporter
MLGADLGAGGALPADVVHAARATLGGAVVAAQQLPGDVGAALLGSARDAFLRGLVLCQIISGVGTLVLAIFAWATFRRVGVSAQ